MKSIEGWNLEVKEKVENQNVVAIFAVSSLVFFVGIMIHVNWL